MGVQDIVLVVFGLWLTCLSVIFYLLLAHYRRLAKGSEKENLEKTLEKILGQMGVNSKEIDRLSSQIEKLEKDGTFHVQKLGLVKYNPFNETGGIQSFSLAVLDGNGSGFVITGLHGRDRTRVYAKPIANGKSSLELSAEERKALSLANK